jgi:hemoglobin
MSVIEPTDPARRPDANVLCHDEGGDAPCWASQFDDLRHDIVGRDDIERLVVAFYRDVAMDDVLGPIFNAARVDWSVHIPKLVDFWAGQLLGERGYDGNPLRAHEPVHARTPFHDAHYQRWLEIFDGTVDRFSEGPVAETAKARARRMARALQRLLAGVPGAAAEPVEVMVVRRTAG